MTHITEPMPSLTPSYQGHRYTSLRKRVNNAHYHKFVHGLLQSTIIEVTRGSVFGPVFGSVRLLLVRFYTLVQARSYDKFRQTNVMLSGCNHILLLDTSHGNSEHLSVQIRI